MTLRSIYGQIASSDVEAIGGLLATFQEELISRVTIWGSAPDGELREKARKLRAAIEAATEQASDIEMPSFTTLHAPMVHVTPHTAVISFNVSLTLKGLLALLHYLNKLGVQYVIREEDDEDFFSSNCWDDDSGDSLTFDNGSTKIPLLSIKFNP